MLKRLTPILALTAACWLVFLANQVVWQGQLNQHGILPRQLASLPGIIWAPFLHASLQHLLANTAPLLVLGGILCLRSRAEFWSVTSTGIVLTGLLTWLAARNGCHIGASGLIFCYFGYLASLALFRRTLGTLALSLVCILGYGGLVKGIVPTAAPISWEGHAAGLFAGVFLAWLAPRPRPTSSR